MQKIRQKLLASNNTSLNLGTTEQDTGRKYNGATVYSKTLAVAAGPNNSTVNTAHGLTMLAVVDVRVQLLSGTTHLCFGSGGFLGADVAHSIQVAIGSTNVGLTSGVGGDFSGYAGSIILEYTR